MKPKSLRAEVIPVPQSNVFLALINESCSPVHPIQVRFVLCANEIWIAQIDLLHGVNSRIGKNVGAAISNCSLLLYSFFLCKNYMRSCHSIHLAL